MEKLGLFKVGGFINLTAKDETKTYIFNHSTFRLVNQLKRERTAKNSILCSCKHSVHA